jgi:uncharacterized protein (DUF952 family)
VIFHLAARDQWQSPESYRPASLEDEGFIHCSTASQLVDVANDRFAGRHDLLLVTIDPDASSAPVVFEDCYETGRRFPHLYGPLDVEAVVSVEAFLPDEHGEFTWDSMAES